MDSVRKTIPIDEHIASILEREKREAHRRNPLASDVDIKWYSTLEALSKTHDFNNKYSALRFIVSWEVPLSKVMPTIPSSTEKLTRKYAVFESSHAFASDIGTLFRRCIEDWPLLNFEATVAIRPGNDSKAFSLASRRYELV